MEYLKVNSKSGNITESGYDKENQKLHVRFKGGSEYQYDCPPNLWREFSATFPDTENSTGSFFHKNIRNLPTKKL